MSEATRRRGGAALEHAVDHLEGGQIGVDASAPGHRVAGRAAPVAEGETLAIPEEDLLGGIQWDSEYERPRKVLLSTKFVRTPSGKVDRIKTLESLKK